MAIASKYIAKTPNAQGVIDYSDAEHATWAKLYARQEPLIKEAACSEYLIGLEKLELRKDRIPQCNELSETLQSFSGWTITPVPALISFDKFFKLLANQTFPAASFIRRPEDMDYLEEPDIFHEIFGHVPLLTDPRFAAFSQAYGEAGLRADKSDHAMLARLYWFTVEFGLIKEDDKLSALEEPIQHVLDAALERKIPCGIHIGNLHWLAEWQKRGMQLICYSTDMGILRNGVAQGIKELKASK